MNQTNETWRPVPSFGGYIASSLGRVRYDHPAAPMLKGSLDKDGYRRVRLRGRSLRVHCIIAETFSGLRPDGYECAHLDGNPANNAAANLKWVTRSENTKHSIEHGTFAGMANLTPGVGAGASHPSAKLTDEQVAEIKAAVAGGRSQRAVARQYGISQTHVCHIAGGKKRAGTAIAQRDAA